VVVSDQMDALFDDEVVAEQVEVHPEQADEVVPAIEEEPAFPAQITNDVVVEPVIQAEEPVAESEPAKAEEEPAISEEPGQVQADVPQPVLSAQDYLDQLPADESAAVEETVGVDPEAEASEPELSDIVAEAEEWMAQVAPEEKPEAASGQVEANGEVAEPVQPNCPPPRKWPRSVHLIWTRLKCRGCGLFGL